MRTTITIDDSLLDKARRRAAERGGTVSDVIDDALRKALGAPPERRTPPAIVIFTDGTGPAAGVDVTSNAALADLLDEGQPIDQRR